MTAIEIGRFSVTTKVGFFVVVSSTVPSFSRIKAAFRVNASASFRFRR